MRARAAGDGLEILYLNEDALPRWFVPIGADVVNRGELASWIAAQRDPRRVAILAEELHGWSPPSRDREPGEVQLRSAEPGRISLALDPAESETLIATSHPGPWGWRARAGQAELRTVTVNGGFLGVVVPPDVSSIELRFVPPGFGVGCAASVAALAGLGTFAAVSRRRRPV